MELDRYWPEVRNTFSFVVANRTLYLFGMLGEVMPLFVTYLLWRMVFAGRPEVGGLTYQQMITYIFVAHFCRVVASFSLESTIANDIRTGTIIRDMVKPQAFVFQMLFMMAGWLLGVALFAGLPAMLIGVLLLGVALPTLSTLPILAVSLLLAFVISFGLTFLTGMSGFWLGSVWGVSSAKRLLLAFAGGSMVPIYLFPDWLRTLVAYLPFQYVVHTPTALYLGQLTGWSAWQALGLQATWAMGLLALSHWVYHLGVKNVTIQGG